MKTLKKIDNQIIHARTTGYSFCQLDNSGTKLFLDSVLIKGSAMYGCALPSTTFFADVISEEISTFLDDFEFNSYTEQEVLLALRLNYSGKFEETIQFSGNTMNTCFLSKILSQYAALRNQLDRKIENHLEGF